MSSPHSKDDEVLATEATDIATLLSENAALKDRLLRALADAENWPAPGLVDSDLSESSFSFELHRA